MKKIVAIVIMLVGLTAIGEEQVSTIYSFSMKTITGDSVALSHYTGKVLLIVNTASKCGFTPQYEGLEQLQQKYAAKGFSVLGFPCNQFGGQEPGSNAEIQSFCTLNYNVTFPMFAKIEVNGSGADPLYQFLTKSAPGILGIESIKWNFTKFLIGKDGKVIKRYAPTTSPAGIASDIESALKQ